jgi:hypothetical protein
LVYKNIRATGEKEWYSSPPRNDWVWINIVPQNLKLTKPSYKALRGQLPYWLLKLGVKSRILYLTFIEVIKLVARPMLNSISSIVRVIPPSGDNQ